MSQDAFSAMEEQLQKPGLAAALRAINEAGDNNERDAAIALAWRDFPEVMFEIGTFGSENEQ